MENEKIIKKMFFNTLKPIPCLPRYFGYVHTIADSPHYHSAGIMRLTENHCIFHYTLKGEGWCRRGALIQKVCAGQGFIGIVNDPDSEYGYPEGGNKEWEFICFCFDGGNAVELFHRLIGEYGQVFTLSPETAIIADLSNEEKWEKINVLNAYESGRYFYDLYSCLVSCAVNPNVNSFHPLVTEVKKLVSEMLPESPTIEEISDKIGYSREYISRLFRSETGMMLKDYIVRKRILFACRLLKETKKTVGEIAELMNFSSCANFSRYFYKVLRLTPSDFRRRGKTPMF